MSNIDKQWLQKTIADMEEHRDLFPGDLDDNHENVLAALRIALASLEAEKSILYRERNPYNGLTTGWQELTEDEYEFIKDNAGDNAEFRTVYAAPPAPVSVPDAYIRDGRGRMMLNGRQEPRIGYSAGWNACRAAMLQSFGNSEQLNSPVVQDCSYRTCRPVTMTDMRFVVCPECGNKRCPHANDHRHACTGSNEPGQEGSAYPAAPQQEGKP